MINGGNPGISDYKVIILTEKSTAAGLSVSIVPGV